MKIEVNLTENSYPIHLGENILKNIDHYFNLQRKVCIVTDTGVPAIYSQMVKDKSLNSIIVTIDEGEENKNIETYQLIIEKLIESNFTRSDCVVAVGGGVVGDLAGFVSATYMRGIDFYNVPTTVLSQIDSSIGGKTAIDYQSYKNIVGAFYQPKGVLIDFMVLNTLDKRQINNGLVEGLKMATTCDSLLFEEFEKLHLDIQKIIIESIKIKRDIVVVDEKEQNVRKVLNFGHTIGHGIESTNLGKLYHGECVGLGMIPMINTSLKPRLIKILQRLGIPTSYKDFDYQTIYQAATHDKKASGDSITIVKVSELGKYDFIKIKLTELEELIKGVSDE